MAYKATGRVVHIGQLVNHSEKFKYREMVLQIDGQYPQEIPIQFTQHRADLLSGITLNSEVTVSFELHGRSNGQGRWFTTIAGFDINKN